MWRFSILLLAPLALSAQPTPDIAGAERVFDAWMLAQMAYRQLPGVAIRVVSDQQLVWARGYGFADIDAKAPMMQGTKFRMASHSKLFTSTAIMQLPH